MEHRALRIITIAACAGAFLLGFGAVKMWRHTREASVAASASVREDKAGTTRPAATGEGRMQELRTENLRLVDELASVRAERDKAVEAASWAKWKEFLGRYRSIELSHMATCENWRLNPIAADIMNLSDREVKETQAALARAQDSIEALALAYLTVSQVSPDRVIYRIEPYNGAEQAKAALAAEIKRALGDERGSFFLNQIRRPLDSAIAKYSSPMTWEASWNADHTVTTVSTKMATNSEKSSTYHSSPQQTLPPPPDVQWLLQLRTGERRPASQTSPPLP